MRSADRKWSVVSGQNGDGDYGSEQLFYLCCCCVSGQIIGTIGCFYCNLGYYHVSFKRKHPRMQGFDYSQAGYYYITVCTHDRLPILSAVKWEPVPGGDSAPAVTAAVVELSEKGRIIEDQLLVLPERFDFALIDKYIIMPNHVHVIIVLSEAAAGASPRPTVMDMVCAFKSLSTRRCNVLDNVKGRKIWQTSFYEEVIRSEAAYHQICEYIYSNPLKWHEDVYFASVEHI